MNSITRIPKFRRCVLQNFPFIEKDFDALTDYQLISKVVEYLNKVIDSQNEVTEETEQLISAFNTLQSYVSTYFDNLDVQEEINNKLDQMAEDGTLEEIVSDYLKTKVNYYHITSSTSDADIISAFEDTESKVIEFDNGTYDLGTEDLFVTSNTIVNLNGATITGHIIFFYPLDTTATAFNGVCNVHFNNGKIGCGCELMHNSNITFNNIEFLATIVQHALAVGGCKNIRVSDCTFDGNVIDDTIKDRCELIQLETCTYESKPYLPEDSAAYDGTGNQNIYIEGCIFKKGNGTTNCYYTAIGHHSPQSEPLHNESIHISNCKFESCRYAMITPCGFSNSIIENCIFDQTDYVSDVWLIKFRYMNKGVTIKGSTFNGGKYNICNFNLTNDSTDIVNQNLTIDSNTFYSTASDVSASVEIRNWTGVNIKNNMFANGGARNIYLGSQSTITVSNITIFNNKFDNTKVSSQNIFISYCNGADIRSNMFGLSGSNNGIYGNPSRSSNIKISSNNVDGDKSVLIGGLTDYTNIYDLYNKIYVQGATYSALTNSSPLVAFNNFNTLVAKVHKNNTAGTICYVEIHPDNIMGKLGAKSYGIYFANESEVLKGKITINSDGTFNYESSDSLVLRELYGINK